MDDTEPIVEILWRRDSRAFARADWDAVADDFDTTSFVGCEALPRGWRILCPSLESYRDMWLAAARHAVDVARRDGDDLEQRTLRTSRIATVEVSGDRALVRKEFGEPGTVDAVVHYSLRRDGDRWLVTSFVRHPQGSIV